MNIEVLEREHGADVVKHLSQALHMPGMSAAEMAAAEAAFDLVPYAEASRRGCVALRGTDGDVFIVLGNPFDLDTQDWLEERLAVPLRYRLALRPDVAGPARHTLARFPPDRTPASSSKPSKTPARRS